ncbi:MAG: DNA-binding response regulator [Planctomycetes bacterium]|jgi:two-component system response regulator MtrA|nr:DNA-binding response regulator [Planctomycetota bacterium]
MHYRILIVEDDEELGKQIVGHFREAGFDPTWFKNGDAALMVRPQDFDLIVLDLMLPGAYGMDVLKHVRQEADVPVLVLSARNETTDKVRALELGADDYMTKPFWPEELLARVQARLRRPVLTRSGVIEVGSLAIDTVGRQVSIGDETVELTRVEFDLLTALAKRPGAAISRTWLVDNVLDPEREGGTRTLDVHISRLRKKLGDVGRTIATVWGVGYRLEPQST